MPRSPIPNPQSLSRWWLLLGVSALAVAGLFALVLVVARTPGLAELPLFDRLFHKALVVHVDLSVLVWFLSIACLMWSLLAEGSRQVFPYLEEGALISFALGTLLIAASPLDPHGEALMSNYIPVLTSPLFFLGLALLACGVLLMIVRLFTAPAWSPRLDKPLRFGIASAGVIAAMAVLAFVWSQRQMPAVIDDPQQYYDLMFWGGGHVLQFVHAQMLLAAWLLLARALSPSPAKAGEGRGGGLAAHSNLLEGPLPNPPPLSRERGYYALFSIGLIAALVTPLAYFLYDVTSMQHRQFFTQGMMIAGGLAPLLLALFMVPVLWKTLQRNALWSALLTSVLLFLYGGLLGGMIEGQNVVIPAHYHGAIVGITLAFMGVAYLLLPQFGWRDVRDWRLAFWQPVIYGGGQAMHITGLAISGGYGVLRKTPGAINEISNGVKAAMGLMGLGGAIAIIGGLLFVIVVAQSCAKRS